jgi:hypothetical protein
MWLLERKPAAVVFLLFILIAFLLPFQVESVHSTVYTSPGFTQIRPNPEVNYYNAYHEFYVIWLHGFFYLTLLFLFFATKRFVVLFASISAFLNLLAYIVMYYGLLFTFNLYGPHITLEIGIGYYASLLLSCLVLMFCIQQWLKFPKTFVSPSNPDLIDDLISGSKERISQPD